VKALSKKSVVRKIVAPLVPEHKAYKYGNALRELNKSKNTHSPIPENTRHFLNAFYEPYNNELVSLMEGELVDRFQKSLSHSANGSGKFVNYNYKVITTCNMCGASTENHRILGKRLNKSQGKQPRKKSGITTRIAKCRKCNLIYSNPQPIPQNLQEHYGVPPENYWKPEYFEYNETYFKGELKELKTILPPEKWKRALDIGAGLGKTMLSLNRAGFDTYGIEPSEPFYERAISKMNIDPSRLTLSAIENAEFETDFFDFITFGAVLEHLYSPSEAIHKAMRWLKPGGIIHIEVPSSKWLINKIANFYYQKVYWSDYVANLSPMHPPYHLYEFGLESFKENSKINKYEIVHHQYYVCPTYLPGYLDFALKPLMRYTNTGMQLCVWLKKT